MEKRLYSKTDFHPNRFHREANYFQLISTFFCRSDSAYWHASNNSPDYDLCKLRFEQFHIRDAGILNPFRHREYQKFHQDIWCSWQYILDANPENQFPKAKANALYARVLLFSKVQNPVGFSYRSDHQYHAYWLTFHQCFCRLIFRNDCFH